jgi:opacity protein-like surface antigen
VIHEFLVNWHPIENRGRCAPDEEGDAMRRWKSWLVSSSAMLTAGLAASDARADDWYINLFGGANWSEDTGDGFSQSQVFTAGPTTATTVSFVGNSDLETDLGWVVGAAVGQQLTKEFRGEVEFSYRRNNGDQPFLGTVTVTTNLGATSTFTTAGNGDSELDQFMLMANVWYEFPTQMAFRPYIGGGIGWGWVNADLDGQVPNIVLPGSTVTMDLFEDDETDNGFAYQVGAGLAMDFSQVVTGFVEYRYSSVVDIQFGSSADPLDADVTNHTVQFGVRIPMK